MLEVVLKKEEIAFVRLDGTLTLKRSRPVSRHSTRKIVEYELPSCHKAFCQGVSLSGGNHVLLADPWWNPKLQNKQWIVHRIGQTKQVYIYEFIVKDRIEVKMQKVQEGKTTLSDAIMGLDVSDKLQKLYMKTVRYLFERPKSGNEVN